MKVLIFPYSWRRVANIECLVKHECFLPDPQQSPSSMSAPRLMLRWGKDKVFPVTSAALCTFSRKKKNPRTVFQLPFPPKKSIPLPTTHMSYGCSDCSQVHNTFHGLISLHASLLLQDQGDVTLQINNNEWDYMTHSPLSISSALCHRTLWAELQPCLSNTKLQDISLGRPVIAMNSLVTHKSFPPRHATRKPLAVRCCHPWSSAGIN